MKLVQPQYKRYTMAILDDTLCTPANLNYIILNLPRNLNISSSQKIVFPIRDEYVTLQQIENTLSLEYKIQRPIIHHRSINDLDQGKISNQIPLQKLDLSFIRKFLGKKSIIGEEFEVICGLKSSYIPKETEQYIEKMQIYLLNTDRTNSFHFCLRSNPKLDLQKQIRKAIKNKFQSKLIISSIHLFSCQLQFKKNKHNISQIKINKTLLRNQQEFIKYRNTQTFLVLFFEIQGQQKKQNGIKVPYINNSEMSHSSMASNINKNLQSTQLIEIFSEQVYKIPQHKPVKDHQQLIFSLILPNGSRMKFLYEQIKYFNIKFLLHQLKIPNPQRRGILIASTTLRPEMTFQIVEKGFVHKVNFIQGVVISEGETFQDEFKSQLQYSSQSQLNFFMQKVSKTSSALELFVTNTPTTLQQQRQPIQHTILRYITNFYTHYHQLYQIYEISTILKRYIKTVNEDMGKCQRFRGWTYRVVNYLHDGKINDQLMFRSFLIASKNIQNLAKLKQSKTITIFKIKSLTGRLIKKTHPQLLDDVIFHPFTKFTIIKRTMKGNVLELELDQKFRQINEVKENIIFWIDKKVSSDQDYVFNHVIRLNQINSTFLFYFPTNQQFQSFCHQHPFLFSEKKNKIIITNMARYQLGSEKSDAGVMTFQICRTLFSTNFKIIYFIGNIERTRALLEQNKISNKSYQITNQITELLIFLQNHCLYNEYKQIEYKKLLNSKSVDALKWTS